MNNNEHERTLKMKREYVGLFEAGYGPREIAKKFGLSESTVYGSLQEIADTTDGISERNELLVQPHGASKGYERDYAPVRPINVRSLLSDTKEAVRLAQKTSAELDQYLAQQDDATIEDGEVTE